MKLCKIHSKKEIEEFCQLVRIVISNTPYYTDTAKSQELEEYTFAVVSKNLSDKTHEYFAAYVGKKMVGFLHGRYDMGTFWINWIGVDDGFRKHGVASKMIGHIEKYMRGKRVHKIWLDTKQNNFVSISFFLKHGYRIVATMNNHWYNADFYLWEKLL